MATAVNVLREAGITASLKKNVSPFHDCGDVQLSEIRKDSGPKNLMNFTQFLADTESIRSAVDRVGDESLVFALGGECSICLGTLAGLNRRLEGEAGMVWIDAHGDFNTPETTPSGYIGGMCLAMACGRGPKLRRIVRDRDRLLSEKNVVHLASRELDPAESKTMSSSPMKTYSASTLRGEGLQLTARLAASSLADRCDWIACHLDVDSIDPKIIPAVNFPAQDGLTLQETKAIVDAVHRTGKMKLFEFVGYNPDLDRDRACATKLVRLASNMFG